MRGTTNGNSRGNTEARRRRKAWVMEAWESDWPGRVRCYRCGRALTAAEVTLDRVVPGCQGGGYSRDNIRPACGPCNSLVGGAQRR